MKRTLALLACFAMMASPVFAAKDKTVATVNGHKIPYSEFDQAYKQAKLHIVNKSVTPEAIVTDLINRELGIQKAHKQKLEKDPTVKYKMEDVLFHAQISKDLDPEFRKITVTDEDVKEYYEKYPEYRTAQILLRTRAIPSEKESEEAQKQAWKIYNTVKADPDKFPELANKFSQIASAKVGGDIGFQPAVTLAKPYYMAIKGKQPGYISKPVITGFGVHIIKVLAIKDFKDINVPVYKKIIYDQKRDQVIEDYFAKMRKGASIQIDKSLLK